MKTVTIEEFNLDFSAWFEGASVHKHIEYNHTKIQELEHHSSSSTLVTLGGVPVDAATCNTTGSGNCLLDWVGTVPGAPVTRFPRLANITDLVTYDMIGQQGVQDKRRNLESYFKEYISQ